MFRTHQNDLEFNIDNTRDCLAHNLPEQTLSAAHGPARCSPASYCSNTGRRPPSAGSCNCLGACSVYKKVINRHVRELMVMLNPRDLSPSCRSNVLTMYLAMACLATSLFHSNTLPPPHPEPSCQTNYSHSSPVLKAHFPMNQAETYTCRPIRAPSFLQLMFSSSEEKK